VELVLVKFRLRGRARESFDDVLARCLAAIEDGGASIESCLADHPAHAERLAPALRTALALRRALAARPDSAFVQRTRARVLAAAGSIRPVAPAPRPSLLSGLRALTERPIWQLSAMSGAAAVLLLAVCSFAMVKISEGAVPGERNYKVKLWIEDAKYKLAWSGSGRRDVQLEIAEHRADELAKLVTDRRESLIEPATNAYVAELAKAIKPVTGDSPPPVAEARKIQASVTRNLAVIESAQAKVVAPDPTPIPAGAVPTPVAPLAVSPETQQKIQTALNVTTQAKDQATQAVVQAEVQQAATATSTKAASPSPSATSTPTASPTNTPTPPASPTATPSATPAVTPEPSATPRPTATATATPATSTPRPAVVVTQPTPDTRPGPITPTTAAAAVPVATPVGTATPSATRTPVPTPTPTPDLRVRVVDLTPGINQFIYFGGTAPVDQALAALAGKYAWVEWSPPGSQFKLYYTPGEGRTPFVMVQGSSVTIYMTQLVTVPLGAVWAPERAR
jgi:hypothetical protein